MSDLQKDWNVITNAIGLVAKLDDSVMGAINRINIALINLEIEGAHIKATTNIPNGIKPITTFLKSIVDDLDKNGKLIMSARETLKESMIALDKHFNDIKQEN